MKHPERDQLIIRINRAFGSLRYGGMAHFRTLPLAGDTELDTLAAVADNIEHFSAVLVGVADRNTALASAAKEALRTDSFKDDHPEKIAAREAMRIAMLA